MATLKKIEIQGYRSIKKATLEIRKLNVLIGANGAGKSNFVSFFMMLNEMMAGRFAGVHREDRPGAFHSAFRPESHAATRSCIGIRGR